MRSLYHLGRSSEAKDPKNPKKVKCDGWTDGPTDGPTDRWTDGPTDGPTKRVVESRNKANTTRAVVKTIRPKD